MPLQLADDNSPTSNKRFAPNSKNPNNGEDEAAAGTSDVASDVRRYDLAWGINRVHNDGGLRMPLLQHIGGLLWRDADSNFNSVADTDYNGIQDANEPGLEGKRVILKQWYWAPVTEGEGDDATTTWQWIQNTAFGNDAYTQAADKGTAGSPSVIPNSVYDEHEGGLWVTSGTDGRYLFDKLPTRYCEKHQGTQLGIERLAGYTVEVLGNVNNADSVAADQRAQAVTGLPATLKQQGADDELNSQAVSTAVSATVNAAGVANGNYALAWNQQTEQSTYGADENGNAKFSKHVMGGRIVLAGVAEANSPVESTVEAVTDDSRTVAFDWNLGRNEDNLDGGFGAYATGHITGTVFQDKNVDGFYSENDINGNPTKDKPVAGETLQLAQWFFVPAAETETIDALKAASFEYDEATSDDGVWFKSKTFSYRTNVSDLPNKLDGDGKPTADKAELDSRIAVDANGWFEGAVTNEQGIYNFDELTSYVYVDYLGEGDERAITDVQPYFPGRKHVNLPVGTFELPGAGDGDNAGEGEGDNAGDGNGEETEGGEPEVTEPAEGEDGDGEGDGEVTEPEQPTVPEQPAMGEGVTLDVVDSATDPVAVAAAQVTSDHLYMTAYRVSLDEVEPDYALTFPHQAKEDLADNYNNKLDMMNDSDAVRVGDGNLVELFEEVIDETDDTDVTATLTLTDRDGNVHQTRNDGYVIVAAEIEAGENGVANTPEGGQYQQTGNTDAASGAAHVATEVFYNGKRYDIPRTVDTPLRGGDAGLVELLKANISGRVWDDANYDGLQATKTETVDGKTVTVVDDDAEPGIADEEIRLTQWIYVPTTKWGAFRESHADLIKASFGLTAGIGTDANGNGVLDDDEIAETIDEGVWVRNTKFGTDRYTAYTYTDGDGNTVHEPYMTGSWYATDAPVEGVVAVNTANGVDSPTGAARGVYLFDKLPTVCVVQNATYDEFYLAAYRVEIPYMNVTKAADTVAGSADDTWLLTRYRATEVLDQRDLASAKLDSDVATLSADQIGIAGGYIISQQNDEMDTAANEPKERQNNGQIILATLVTGDEGNKNTTEEVDENNNMWTNKVQYDWMLELPDGTALHHGGDVGEVLPPYQSITGTVWKDMNNDGLQGNYTDEDGNTLVEPGVANIQVSLERYGFVADGTGAWMWDTQWADEYPATYADNVQAASSPMKPAVAKNWAQAADGTWSYDAPAYANVTTDANGTYTFGDLKSSDRRWVKDGAFVEAGTEGAELVTVIYGYKVRVTDAELRGRHILAANVHEGDDYTVDSDLNYADGYLMEENEYTVLLEVEDTDDYVYGRQQDVTGAATNQGAAAVTVLSQPSNVVAGANSLNPNQNEIDRYNRMPAASVVKTTNEATAPATLRYDLAKGANRANNDAGVMDIPMHYISGYLFHDTNYDGVYQYNGSDSFTVDGKPYTEAGLVGKKVILKQWYFVPETDADGNVTEHGGQWVLVENFHNHPGAAVEAAADFSAAVAAVTAAIAAQAGAVECSTLTQAAAGNPADPTDKTAHYAGYYIFDNLPVYVAVEGTEYLAGYTVEVLGGSTDNAEAVNFPVTRIEERGVALADDEQESTAQVIGTQLLENVGGTVTYTDGTASVDTYGNTNYPLGWQNLTGQAQNMFPNDDPDLVYTNTSNSTLDGMIVLAGNTTTYTQDDNYKIDQTRDGVEISFDMATGRDEDKLSGGYGYFGTTEVSGTVFFDADFDGVNELGQAADDGDKPVANQKVELTQWFYLAGTGTVATVTEGESDERRTYEKVTFTADPVVNAKGQQLRAAKVFEGEKDYEIELVYDGGDVVGAWIKNPAFGTEITDTVTDEEAGTSTTVVTGYTGSYTMDTLADGTFAFNETNTKGLLPYVQFDAERNPLHAGDIMATDDVLAMASYRVAMPEGIPAGHVLTVFHVDDANASDAWATNTDSDAKRDVLRSSMVDGYDTPIVTSYPQFEAAGDGEQPDGGFASTTGFILTASSALDAKNNQPYTFEMGGITYDVASEVAKREHVNTGLFKVPTSQITGIVWDDTEADDNTASDGVRDTDEPGLANQTVLATQWYYVPAEAAAFPLIDADEGIVEWVAADGSKTVGGAAPAGTVGAWVQNTGFGNDWVSTKAVIYTDPNDLTATPQVVRVPVVTGGENRADANGVGDVVAVKTYAAGATTTDADGNTVPVTKTDATGAQVPVGQGE